jgi:hypothetical protein
LNDDELPRLLERARGGDWDAIEDLLSGILAPTFDAALHLTGDPAKAGPAAEEALVDVLLSVKSGAWKAGDPLAAAARALARRGSTEPAPFEGGLSPEDLVAIGRRPDDARRGELARVAAADRVAAVLAYALDIAPDDLASALGRPPAEVAAAIDRVLAAIPHEDPAQAFRDVLDTRAARARVPGDLEDRILDRVERRE